MSANEEPGRDRRDSERAGAREGAGSRSGGRGQARGREQARARGRAASGSRRPAPRRGSRGRSGTGFGKALGALVLLALVVTAVTFIVMGKVPGIGGLGPWFGTGASTTTSTVEATSTTKPSTTPTTPVETTVAVDPSLPIDEGDGIKVGTYLGNETRRFYGIGPVPETLRVIWKCRIGTGKTSGTATVRGATNWSGTGWTGQCTIIRDKGKLYLVSGGFDHGLRKIDAETGEVVWRYEFPDVIKGTNTIWIDPNAKSEKDRIVVIAGSRRGFGLSMASPLIAPVRAVSFATGKELWRVPVAHTQSYSRDADASAIVRDGIVYQGLESAQFLKLDPSSLKSWNKWKTPKVLASTILYEPGDASAHGGNVVFEASPAAIGDTIYAAAGSGRIYGLRTSDLKEVWQYRTGSDLDGSVCTTKDGYLLIALDREFIKGRGGVIKLDPRKTGKAAAVWYLPTENRTFVTWQGGIIGSVSVNDNYDPDNSRPALAAATAIDGNLYVFSQDQTKGTALIYDNKTRLPTPIIVAKKYIGGAISTPIIVDDHVIACGYDAKVHVYRIVYDSPDGKGVELKARDGHMVRVSLKETDTFSAGSFESTPVVWNGRIYIGSRDGYLYCLGE
jgi:outer membrane protein assembly factor BamB